MVLQRNWTGKVLIIIILPYACVCSLADRMVGRRARLHAGARDVRRRVPRKIQRSVCLFVFVFGVFVCGAHTSTHLSNAFERESACTSEACRKFVLLPEPPDSFPGVDVAVKKLLRWCTWVARFCSTSSAKSCSCVDVSDAQRSTSFTFGMYHTLHLVPFTGTDVAVKKLLRQDVDDKTLSVFEREFSVLKYVNEGGGREGRRRWN